MCPQRHASCPGPPSARPALTRGAVRRTFMSGCPRALEEASCNVMQNRVKSPNAIRRGWRQPRRGRSRLKACRAARQPGGMVWTGRVGCRKAPVQPGPRRMWPGRTAADRIAARAQCLPRRMPAQKKVCPGGQHKKNRALPQGRAPSKARLMSLAAWHAPKQGGHGSDPGPRSRYCREPCGIGLAANLFPAGRTPAARTVPPRPEPPSSSRGSGRRGSARHGDRRPPRDGTARS